MKTKYITFPIELCAGLLLLVTLQANCQSDYVATNAAKFPGITSSGGENLLGGGYVTNYIINSYPYTRIGGDGQGEEFQFYTARVISERKSVPEILPVEQDTNGNWGTPSDGLQLSLRFPQPTFVQTEMVPAHIILRNLKSTGRKWLRNALPDDGYQFTLKHGTNSVTWSRPQTQPVYGMTDAGSMNEHDPYRYVADPHTEGLTIVYLNRFFDLSQPGKYSLQVQIKVPATDGKSTTSVVSGTATFEIIEKSSP